MMIARERCDVVAAARSWLGTPFHHAQRVQGAGVDCAQLLIAVYCDALGLVPPPDVEHYGRDWFMHERGTSRLLATMRESCIETTTPGPGDIAVFQFGRSESHSAIVTAPPSIIHADRMLGRVLEDRCDVNDALSARLRGYWTLRRWRQE